MTQPKIVAVSEPYKVFVPSGWNPYLWQAKLFHNVLVEYPDTREENNAQTNQD